MTTAATLVGLASMQVAPPAASAKMGAMSQSPRQVRRAFIGTRAIVPAAITVPNPQIGQVISRKCNGTAANAHAIFNSLRNGIKYTMTTCSVRRRQPSAGIHH